MVLRCCRGNRLIRNIIYKKFISIRKLRFKMSSKSENEEQKANQQNKSKRSRKPVRNGVPEKKTRRAKKKNSQSQNEYVLPQQIPLSSSPELIIHQSFEHQTTKVIIQVPLVAFKSPSLVQQIPTRVQSNNINIRLKLADPDTIVIQAKLEKAQSNEKQQEKPNKKQMLSQQVGNKRQGDQKSESEQSDLEKVFHVNGRVYWVGNYEVVTKINKQCYKTIFRQYSEIQKIKTKEVNSDIFIVINFREKIDCVSDYNGLINQGNTCYMNSYLQMLYHLVEFRNLVFEAQMIDENKFPATLQILFYRLGHDHKSVSAEQLVKSFGWSKKQAQIQQDAQQFSCLFFEVLERKLNEVCGESDHMSMGALFWGRLEHKIACTSVDYGSVKTQTFLDLQLDPSIHLSVALDNYVSEQLLAGDNMYATEFYGKQEAHKSVRIEQLPPILMIQLKRFEFSPVTYKNQKIMTRFQYPQEIDFRKWMVDQDPERPEVYQLYGVLVHEGKKAESGHYYVYLKVDGQWYKFNDQEVSIASKEQVFEYNFGGEIQVKDIDSRELKIKERKIMTSSTAYMLVYVKKELEDQLLHCQTQYPQWLKQREAVKQEEKEEMKARKNFYHDIQSLDWDNNLKEKPADYIGLLPRDQSEIEFESVEKITKLSKIDEWVKPYNEKDIGAFLYLTSNEKTEYETLVNLQHRKCSFQQTVKDPNCPIIILFAPILPKIDNYVVIVKKMEIKDGKKNITFDHILSFPRSKPEGDLFKLLTSRYEEEGFNLKFYYEEKKELASIRKETNLVRGPQTIRNVLVIVIVQKLKTEESQEFLNPTRKWYTMLKNNVDLVLRSDDMNYEDQIQIDQNISVEELRQYIFDSVVKRDENYISPENIVLKGKVKKSSKTFVEIAQAKTVKDLIKNCDKDLVIYFCPSNLKVEQRLNQIQIKMQYRFKDFSFSDPFHIVLGKNTDNSSENIYEKIASHEEIQNFLRIENFQGLRVFLFTKDRTIINDIVNQKGYVNGKGKIGNVLQKQKGSQLIIEGCEDETISVDKCPILLHHKSLNGDRIGKPRYIQANRNIRLVDLYSDIVETLKNEEYEWEEKIYQFNPMRLYIWIYGKDYSKGLELMDEASLIEYEKCKQEEKNKNKNKNNSKESEKNGVVDLTKKQNEDQEEKSQNEQKQAEKKESQEQGSKKSVKQKKSRVNKTLEDCFPKAKVIKVSVHHQYLTRSQNVLKINVE